MIDVSMKARNPDSFIDTFAAVKRRVSALATQAYATIELGSMQAKTLRHIGKHSRISQAELARATDSDPALIGRAIASLIERDLVRRTRSEEDRREYMLELTAAGKRTCERVARLRGEIVARLTDALDDKDLADFERIAAKLLAAAGVPQP
jgi:DNA-binding MarR family transcriptional regulator